MRQRSPGEGPPQISCAFAFFTRQFRAQQLLGKAVELAKAGNVVMLKFLLGRILPRERLIKLDLPRMGMATMR
jgi:hypothetical protein